jgi:hypothetical protein
MADLSITCTKCKAVTVVSEFVDEAHLKCSECGAALEKPGALEQAALSSAKNAAAPLPRSKLRLRKNTETDPLQEDATPDDSAIKNIIQAADEDAQDSLDLRPEVKSGGGVPHALLAGLIFLVLGGALGYLRYGGVLPEKYLTYSVEYAWIAALVIHFLIVIKAMTENMMQGILSLLIPGYSLYYLFGVSDSFYLRAVVGALLIGIGQDAAVMLREHAGHIAGIVNGFIAGGGGDIR